MVSITTTPDATLAISSSVDCTVKVWNLFNGNPVYDFTSHKDWVLNVVVDREGKRMLSASKMEIKIWDLCKGTELGSLRGHEDWVLAVVISPDGHFAVSASRDKTLIVWNLENRQKVFSFCH